MVFLPIAPKDYSLKKGRSVNKVVYVLLFIIEKLRRKGTSHSQEMVVDQRRSIGI